MYSDRQAWANSIDPDETPHSAASHLGLYCLPLIQQFFDITSGSKLYLLNFRTSMVRRWSVQILSVNMADLKGQNLLDRRWWFGVLHPFQYYLSPTESKKEWGRKALQCSAILSGAEFRLQWEFNPRPWDPNSEGQTTQPTGCFFLDRHAWANSVDLNQMWHLTRV